MNKSIRQELSRKDATADKKDKVFVSFVRFVVNLYDFLTGAGVHQRD